MIQSLQKELNDLQRISLDELRMLALRPPTDEIIGHVIKMPEFEQNDLENSETQKDADAFKAIVQKTPPGMLALIAILEYIKPGDQKNSKFEEVFFCLGHIVKVSYCIDTNRNSTEALACDTSTPLAFTDVNPRNLSILRIEKGHFNFPKNFQNHI